MVGCAPGGGPGPEPGEATDTSGASTAGATPTAAADTVTSPTVRPEEIYFDLTELEWYRRGEPLVHAGVGYQPAGSPVPRELSALKPAGTYQGVRYYVRAGAQRADTLFVPVYPRYWLPFRSVAVREGGS